MPCVTSGTQKWKGDNPSLMARAIVIRMDAVGSNNFMMVHWLECIRLIIIASISNEEAVACVRKYLAEASVARGLGFIIMMGIIAIMFISSPIQANNQWELIVTIVVLRMRVVSRVIETNGLISMGRI